MYETHSQLALRDGISVLQIAANFELLLNCIICSKFCTSLLIKLDPKSSNDEEMKKAAHKCTFQGQAKKIAKNDCGKFA